MPLRSYSEAEIILKARRRLERPLMVLIWLGLTAFSLAEGSGFYFLAGTAAVAVNLLAVHRAQEVYVHRLFVNIGVLVSTGILTIEIFTVRRELLNLLGHYLILIQICKLFERKAARDYVQMLALSMLLVVASTLLTMDFWLALLLVVYLTLAGYTVMIFTLKRKLDQAAADRLVSERSPLHAQRVAWNAIRAWPGRSLILRSVGCTVLMLLVGMALFLISPRETQVNAATASGWAVSAFGQNVHLGDASARQVYLSDRAVMTVRLGDDLPAGAWANQFRYLRGQTFNAYARSRWARVAGRVLSPLDLPPPPQITPEMSRRGVVQEISQMASVSSTILFAAGPPASVVCPQGNVRIDGDGEIHFAPKVLFEPIIRYSATSWAMPLTLEQREYLAAQRLRSGSPADSTPSTIYVSPAVDQLARQWCQDLLDRRLREPGRSGEINLQIAERLEARLKAHATYTLDLPPVPPEKDAVESFLFQSRRGHCEYFASALTVMCHSLGVPARLATGFQLEDTPRAGASYTIRDRDAHAWTEVFTEQTDWVAFDATPASADHAGGGAWNSLKDAWSAASFWWYEHVISYDNSLRHSLGRWALQKMTAVWQALKAAAGDLRDSLIRLLAFGTVDAILVRMAMTVGAVGLMLEGLILVRLLRRQARARQDRSLGRAAPVEIRFLLRLMDLLQANGVGLSPGQTARQVAAEAAQRLGLDRAALDGLVELYYRMRWGRQSPVAAELAAAEDQVDRLAQALRQEQKQV